MTKAGPWRTRSASEIGEIGEMGERLTLTGERAINYDPVLNGWEVGRRLSGTEGRMQICISCALVLCPRRVFAQRRALDLC